MAVICITNIMCKEGARGNLLMIIVAVAQKNIPNSRNLEGSFGRLVNLIEERYGLLEEGM